MRPLLLSLVCLVAAGCGHAHRRAAVTYSVILKAAPAEAAAGPLPVNYCFVASRRYEVQIMGRSALAGVLCDGVARTYRPREPRLRWPPPYLRRGSDAASSVVCNLANGPDRLEIDYGPADSGRIDAGAICDRLVARGWKRLSNWAVLDGT